MSGISPYPISISPATIQMLRASSAGAEVNGSLLSEQLNVIYGQNWFNLFVPVGYAGRELSLPEALRVEESIAWIDGSLGWTVTLCSGANFFIGFLPEKVRSELFANPRVCFAGSGYPSGLATRTPLGYRVSGRWKYATGIPHATVITASCNLRENDILVPGPDGNPLVQAFWFLPGEVHLIEEWDAMGMIATASHGFEINSLDIPHERRFSIDTATAQLPHDIFRYPFLQFAECTLVANLSGMTIRFIELAREIFVKRGQETEPLDRVEAAFAVARERFYAAADGSWKELVEYGMIAPETLQAVSDSVQALAGVCREVFHAVYPLCGLAAAMRRQEINRVWRNFHTASQHSAFQKLKVKSQK